MATRNPNQNPSRDNGTTQGIPRDSVTSPASSSTSQKNPVEIVKSSSAYQNASELMANYPEWLARLDAIAESAAVSQSPGPFEVFTNKLSSKIDAAISSAITEISNLIAQFTEWRNSLPSTQKSQLNSAGIYDTSGITSSGFTNNPSAPNVGLSMDNDSTAAIQSIVSAVSSVGGNFVGLVSALGNIGIGSYNAKTNRINADTNKFNARTNRGKSSYEILSDVVGKGGNILNPYDDSFISNHQALDESVYGRSSYNKAMEGMVTSDDSLNVAIARSSAITDIYSDIAQLQVDVYRQEQSMRKSSAKYHSDYYDNKSGKVAAAAENAESVMRKAHSEGNAIIDKHFNKLIDKWADKAAKGSFIHAILLTNLRTSGNLGIQDAVNTGVDAVSSFMNPVHKTQLIK